jgi:hypothetical protein
VLPLVDAITEHCDVVEVAGPVDHRTRSRGGARPGWSSGAWAVPGSAAQLAALGLTTAEVADRVQLQVGGRPMWALREDGHCMHLEFDELCVGHTCVGDVLELAGRYRTLVPGEVPACRASARTPGAASPTWSTCCGTATCGWSCSPPVHPTMSSTPTSPTTSGWQAAFECCTQPDPASTATGRPCTRSRADTCQPCWNC